MLIYWSNENFAEAIFFTWFWNLELLNDSNLFVPVLANYSKPQTTQECHDGLSCVVHCVSHGGYPRIRITWDVLDSHMWRLENNSEVQDPDTLMVNSSSSASFNCSSGKVRSIRCCVGDSTSDHITVCKFWRNKHFLLSVLVHLKSTFFTEVAVMNK